MIVTVVPVTITFLKMAPYRIAIVKEDIRTHATKIKDKNHEKDLTKNILKTFLTCNVFVLYKNMLCFCKVAEVNV